MMYPRLKLARNLLTEDGVIFISIDDNEQDNLKKICNEIFGEENFISNIMWKRKKEVSNDSKNISIQGENIIVYLKSLNGFLNLESLSDDYIKKSYKESNEKFTLGKWRGVPITVSKGLRGGGYNYKIVSPSGNIFERTWAYPESSFKKLLAEGRIYFGLNGDSLPQRVMYLFESEGQPTTNYWDNVSSNKEGKKEILSLFNENYFDTPKPVNLIKKILLISSNKDSIILDFFSGSATTAHAVMQLNSEDGGNRKYIMVQLPEPCDEKSEAYKAGYKTICEIGKERIRRAGEKIKEEIEKENSQLKLGEEPKKVPDIGFKVFKLDSSNIKEWDSETEDLEQSLFDSIDNIKSDRSSLDILYEILLKYGLDLNVPIIENDKFYSIGGGTLLINLDKEIDMEVIDSICEEYKNLLEIDEDFKTMVVLRDSAFKNDVDKTNAMKKLEQVGIKEVRSI